MLLRSTPAAPDTPPEVRRRPLDNPRVLTVAACLLVAILAALFWLASRTSDIALPLLTDVLLYVLIALDFVLLASLGFVLARSLLKLWVEQRQAAPFARFRGKLVAALLAMTILPSVLVLISGSTIIGDSAERWFSEPVDEVLSAAQAIAKEYYDDRLAELTLRAQRLARVVPPATIASADVAELGVLVSEEPKSLRDGLVEIYRTIAEPGRPVDVEFVFSVQSTLPRNLTHASADRLAASVVASRQSDVKSEDLASGTTLLRSAAPVLDADGVPAGVVVVSQVLSSEVKSRALAATAAYESYQKKRVLKGPLSGIYQSVFLAISLLILMSATWLGLYLAKRITRPVQMLADSARAIGAGQLDLPRLEPEAGDELGSLVESFNMMAAELRTSRERVEQSRRDLEQKNLEVDARRRYIETILERVATGVISLDAEGRISTVNGAAERLLGLDATSVGQPILGVLRRDDLSPLLPLVESTSHDAPSVVHEITLAREGREIHLAAASTVLGVQGGRRDGVVLVLDDVTPLIRAQRVAAWRDVARRLAHEIKNPLTPIQLSAERLRRYFGSAPEQTLAFVSECTGAIITEVEALKNLVDEFAQFARLRGPRMLRTDVNRLIEDTLALYGGILQQRTLRIQRRLAATLPAVRLDAEQMRQVIINLVDNAVEALGGAEVGAGSDGAPPTIVVSTAHDARSGVVRIVVSDNGPGVPPEDRDKLFMPYYSTKGRGSGLGLAIVRRIIVEHGGSIVVGPMLPSGTVFTIEMPEV
jgi:two-component system nitrogen regulation sensor histidine kinase NtrY